MRIGIDVLVPSDLSLNEDINKVVVLNNAIYPIADSLSPGFSKPLSEKELNIIDTIVIRHLFDGLFSILDDSPKEVLNNSEYFEYRNPEHTSLPKPLSESSVRDFSKDTESDIFLSFEYYNFNIDSYYDYSYFPEVHSYLKFNRQCLWRIYEKNGGILDEYFLNDTVYWSSAGYSKNDADYGLPDISEALKSAFFYAGVEYGKHISPSWLQASRVYFRIKNNRKLLDFKDYSFDKEKLLEIASSKKNEAAYRAAINLTLLFEKEDDLTNSLKWLNEAEKRKPGTKLVSEYMKIIRERILTNEKLEKQLNYN